MPRNLLLLLLLLFFIGCEPKSFETQEEFFKYINSVQSGYLKQANTEDLIFQFKHLPHTLNADVNDTDEDSILNLAFQFRVLSTSGVNLMNYRTTTLEDQNKRVTKLEYKMKELFSGSSSKTIEPTFIHYENFRGIKNEILIHVHFTLLDNLKKDFTIYFDDQIFQSGLHQFVFKKEKIINPPVLNSSRI